MACGTSFGSSIEESEPSSPRKRVADLLRMLTSTLRAGKVDRYRYTFIPPSRPALERTNQKADRRAVRKKARKKSGPLR